MGRFRILRSLLPRPCWTGQRQFGDFEKRRKIVDDLDVRVTLAMEDGQRVIYAQCRIGEAAIPIDRPSTRSWAF